MTTILIDDFGVQRDERPRFRFERVFSGVRPAVKVRLSSASVFSMNPGFLVIGLLSLATSTTAAAATVLTDKGPVASVPDNGAEVFRAIPYAAPPVGPLRWKPPQPVQPWTVARDSGKFSSVCPQSVRYPPDSPVEPMDEDCLYLNVWRPDGERDHLLPVMVWIYGGGLESGSASTPLYHGDVLSAHGVIVVTFNYRLGALGFLAHPELTAESADHVSGNYGLLDQVAALEWVHRNIAAFGGDPKNVTVFGQSSGSISISVLSVMPSTAGLFQRAIGESGGLFEPLELADNFALRGAEQEGIEFAQATHARSIEELRAMTPDALLRAPFFPHFVVDGQTLVESPYTAYRGERNHVFDLLEGYNADDGAWAIQGRTVTTSTMSAILTHDFPPLLVRLAGPSQQAADADANRAAAAFERDMRFGWDMTAWARLHAEQSRGNTFFYHFRGIEGQAERCAHGSELAYVFGHPPSEHPWTEGERQLSTILGSYWTHFAATGDPNSSTVPRWPRTTAENDSRFEIGESASGAGRDDFDFVPAINRVYGVVRFLAKYGVVVLVALVAVFVALVVWVIRIVRRRRRAVAVT